jgi:hypothetical protein
MPWSNIRVSLRNSLIEKAWQIQRLGKEGFLLNRDVLVQIPPAGGYCSLGLITLHSANAVQRTIQLTLTAS